MFIISILVFSIFIFSSSPAEAKAYDGIWFMGFNLKSEVAGNAQVRQAVNLALNKDHIARALASAEVVPASVIPHGMLGYDPDLSAVFQDRKQAKEIMEKAGYPVNDKRLKDMTLLHTDGIKTISIAKQIQNDLRYIGIKVRLIEVSYQDEDVWIKELLSGKHDFFLLGYKAGIEKLFTSEEASAGIDSYNLVEPLFKTGGEANFTGYSNAEVDKLLGQISGFDVALKSERHERLKKINQVLYNDLPVIVLFYIEKL